MVIDHDNLLLDTEVRVLVATRHTGMHSSGAVGRCLYNKKREISAPNFHSTIPITVETKAIESSGTSWVCSMRFQRGASGRMRIVLNPSSPAVTCSPGIA